MKKHKAKSVTEKPNDKVTAFTYIPRWAKGAIKKKAKEEHRSYSGQLGYVLTEYAHDNTLAADRL